MNLIKTSLVKILPLLKLDNRRPSQFVTARALQVPPENQVWPRVSIQVRRLELAVAMRTLVAIPVTIPNE